VGNGLFLTVQMLSHRVEWLCTSWRLPPVSRRTCQRYRVALYEDKKNGGFNLLKPPHEINRHGKSVCPAAVFFFSAAGQISFY